MFKIYCPECGKEFTVKHRNDRAYCKCQLPLMLILVPPYNGKTVKKAMAQKEANYANRKSNL